MPRKLEEVVNITNPETITEKELRPQRVKMKKQSTNGQIRDVDVSQTGYPLLTEESADK